jgi:hypothetical protein
MLDDTNLKGAVSLLTTAGVNFNTVELQNKFLARRLAQFPLGELAVVLPEVRCT